MCEEVFDKYYYIITTFVGVLLCDIYTIHYTSHRVFNIRNIEILQYLYNQLEFFVKKLDSFIEYLKSVDMKQSLDITRLVYFRCIIDDLCYLVWRCVVYGGVLEMLSISMLVNTVLRMLRKLIESMYMSLSTIFDKYIKFLD